MEAVSAFCLPPPIVWRYPQESYLSDSRLIYRLKPRQEAFTQSSPVSINSYGLRDREFPLKPPAATTRILCLGDSLTFGNGVPASATYPKQLEAILNRGGHERYEEVNGGTPGYDKWQEQWYPRE